MSAFPVTEKAMRPARPERECFYCRQPVGGNHSLNCGLIVKRVKMQMILTYEEDFPSDFDPELIEFSHNEGTWCVSNILDVLAKIEKEDGCLCGSTEFKFVAVTSEPYLSEI